MGIQAKFLLLISVLLVLVGSPAGAQPPSPEETAELYYRAWLNFDRASMVRLDKEWGASGSGQRYTDMELVADPIAWQRQYKGVHSPRERRANNRTSSQSSGWRVLRGCSARRSLHMSARKRLLVFLSSV